MTRRWVLVLVLAFAGGAVLDIWVIAPLRAQQQPPDRTHAIGKKLKCMCRGCQDSAATCYHVGGAFSGPCDTAKAMLKTIAERIAKGDSDDLIVQSLVQQYGQEVYIEPPHSGVGSVAWGMPVAYLVLGTGLVILVISRWRRRGAQTATSSDSSATTISREALEKARRRVMEETQD